MKFLLIGIGGALGALSRSYLSEWIEKLNFLPMPMGVLLVNFLGCFFLGLMINSLDPKYQEIYQPLVFIGFLGAFTTFSAFSRESLDLLNQGQVSTCCPICSSDRAGLFIRNLGWCVLNQ